MQNFMPNNADMIGVARGLLRVQDTYALLPDNIAAGDMVKTKSRDMNGLCW